MHRRHGTILLAAVLLFFCTTLSPLLLDSSSHELCAQESPPAAEQEPPAVEDDAPATVPQLDVVVKLETPLPEQARVGRPIELDFRIEHPASATLEAPDASASSRYTIARSDLTVLSSPEQGPHVSSLHLTLLPVRAGTASFVDLKLGVRGETGGEIRVALLPDELKFSSSLGQEDATLEPALPPRSIERPDYTPVKIATGALGLAILAGLVMLGVRAMRPEPLPPPPPAIEDVALDALQGLAEEPPATEQETVRFYTRMSEVMRDYLGSRYGFPGTEYTTSEILAAIPLAMLPPALGMSEIAQWLRASDRVKFSNSRPVTEAAMADLRKAIAMVELTRPPREAEVAPELALDGGGKVEENQMVEVGSRGGEVAQGGQVEPVASSTPEEQTPRDDDAMAAPRQVGVEGEARADDEQVSALKASLGAMSWEELSELVEDDLEKEEDGDDADEEVSS